MTAVLPAESFDELLDFVRLQVAAGFAPVEAIVDDAVELLAQPSTSTAHAAAREMALRQAAWQLTEQSIAEHLAEQGDWPDTTDCDRLDAAFAELEQSGILARQHFSCCGTCGADEIRHEIDRASKAGAPVRGFTFFHVQDTEHAVAGDGLYLSFGAAGTDKQAAVAIGREVLDVLGRHGLSPSWNGHQAHRIALPLQWRRRRG